MKKIIISILLLAALGIMLYPAAVTAAPDLFSGDTKIYGGSPVVLKPNVLIIIDNSASMASTVPAGGGGSLYDHTITYAPVYQCTNSSGLDGQACDANTVYDASYNFYNASINNLSIANTCTTSRTSLTNNGLYSGKLSSSGGTACSGTTNKTYYTGNYINWLYDASNNSLSKASIAQAAMSSLVQTTANVKFGLMTFYPNSTTGMNGGSVFLNVVPAGTLPAYVTTVKDMDPIFSGAVTNRQALSDVIQSLTFAGGVGTLDGEALFEAIPYFSGGAPAFNDYTKQIGVTVATGGTGTSYVTPIEFGCQKNYVILVTDGMTDSDTHTALNLIQTTYGTNHWDGGFCVGYGGTTNPYTTCNGSNNSTTVTVKNHVLAGVAKYLYQHDLRSSVSGTQNVTTFTVGFGLTGADKEASDLLRLTADINHGNGAYYAASSAQELDQALTKIMGSIFTVDTSFVAPVVPVSPENKTYSGSRVYMGFFKPEMSAVWDGNLKKFGLDANANVMDAHSTPQYATYIDNDAVGAPGYGYDDRDGTALPKGSVNGSFRSTALSYWSSSADAGIVDNGGAGEKLLGRSMTISSATADIAGAGKRKIYTYTGTNTDLTNSTNDFSTLNSLLTSTTSTYLLPGLVISTSTMADKKTLINFISGFNTYTGSFTDKRSWILGDILHSKPYVMNYSVYDTSVASNETNSLVNQTMIFAGSNDGMLHAFNDYDGSEAWAFIPPDLLSTLQYLRGNAHSYFVDSTITPYVYQANPSVSINTATDKVVIVIGLRRGGGSASEPTKGFYYALDVTNRAAPKFLWSISNDTRWSGTTKTSTTDFGDMGETWSEPKIVKLKVGSADKIAILVGGGYDNCNEDARFGSTQNFSGSCVGSVTSDDTGYDGSGNPVLKTSTPAATVVTTFNAASYKGRAVYVVELATLNSSGVPAFTSGSTKLWGYSLANTPALQYSMLSEITALDTNYDGYVDRFYMGDSGGNIWRFNVMDTNTSNWTVAQIFVANPGYTNGTLDSSNGRKIFYKPSAVIDTGGLVRLYFGTGDREHPLNFAVTDRMYEVVDKGQTIADNVTEAKLVDVTEDLLQTATDVTDAAFQTMKQNIAKTNDNTNTELYGWYIRLNQNPGEKVVAGATAYKKAIYYSTYTPNITDTSVDPCTAGNLGTARIYVLDYQNGNSVINYDVTNDDQFSTYSTNINTTSQPGQVLLRSDRVLTIGGGIPSGVVVAADKILIGCGGGLCMSSTAPGGQVIPVYWRQR